MIRGLLSVPIAVILAVQVLAGAQQVQPRADDSQRLPIIRRATRVVNVNVVVTDGEGRPVQGLGKDDFQILDNGRPEEIAFFSARSPDDDTDSGYSGAPLAPGEYSNDAHRAGTPQQGTTIILFDTVNTPYLSQAYDLGRIRIFLRRQLQPHDRVGIYVLNENGLKVVYDPRQPAGAFLGAMHRYEEAHKGGGSKAVAAADESTGLAELDRFLHGRDDQKPLIGSSQIRCEPQRFPITIAAFQEIARNTAGLRGRKAIIWVADSMALPFIARNGFDLVRRWRRCGVAYDPDLLLEDPANLKPLPGLPSPPSVEPTLEAVPDRGLSENDELDLLLRLLNQNNIALYPVRADGLRLRTVPLFGPQGMDSTAFADYTATESVLAAEEAVSADPLFEDEIQHAMGALARWTGGRAYYNRDLETGIRRALDDAEYGYELTYYPDHGRWDGDWHKIEVKVNRPDVTVLARGGYYAFPEPRLLPPKARKQLLEEIAASPLEDTEIPATVKLNPPAGPAASSVEARVYLSAQNLFTSHSADEWDSDFEVLFFQLDPKNKILDVTTQSIALNFTQEKYSEALKRGIKTLENLHLKPGAVVLYVIVHDKMTDAVGSVRIPLNRYAAPPQRTEPTR